MIQKKSITGEPTVFVTVHGLKLEIRNSGEMKRVYELNEFINGTKA